MRVGPLIGMGLALALGAGCGARTWPCADSASCDDGSSGPGSTRTAEIALGWAHTCAVDGAGTVRCFGSNANGQLGVGQATGYPTEGVAEPVTVPLAAGARRIAAGGSNTCALTSEVACWGNDGSGHMGLAATDDVVFPTRVEGLDGGRVVSVHVGDSSNACALFDDGTARCWGTNESGQIAPGSEKKYFAAPIAAPVSGIRELALGGTFTCALTMGGAVTCWGCTWKAEGGNDYCTSPEPAEIAGVDGARAIAAGRGHACAVRADGTVWCWGLNMWKQLGDTTWITRPTAAPVVGVADAEGIALGWDHTCAITRDHRAICWGANDYGAIGNGADVVPAEPAPVLRDVKVMSGGGGHTCALRDDGSTWCWGWNPYGQVGDGTREHRLVPVEILAE